MPGSKAGKPGGQGGSPPEEIVERRVSLRVPLHVLQVRGESRKAFFVGYAVNLSLGGIFIQTTRPKETGTRVRLQIPLQRELPPIECGAEVFWIQPFSARSKNPPGMGLRFTELGEKATARLEAFLKSQEGRRR